MVTSSLYKYDYRVRRYAEALVSINHKVDAFVLRGKDEKKQEFQNGVNIFRIQERKADRRNLWSYALQIIWFFIKVSAILTFRHFKYRYKIIHVHNPPDFMVFAALIPKLFGANVILDMHENLPELYCIKFGKGPETLGVRMLLFLERISTHFADIVIAAHDLLAQRIIGRDNISPDKCTPILNYPNVENFGPHTARLDGKYLRIVYPGMISYRHGIDIAIKAVAIIRKEVPSVEFHIYSELRNDKYYRAIINLIHDLDLGGNVKLFGAVKHEELGKIFSNASFGVVPKRGGIFGSEAFSTKMLEFMAVGLPVVASRTKIEEYYFDDSMIKFFEPEDHQDLAKCILELYNDTQKRKVLAANAKKFVSKNNWGVKKEIYYKIVEDLIYAPEDRGSARH
jgi:glycosyltransferase involved in cell wall biosynthesis